MELLQNSSGKLKETRLRDAKHALFQRLELKGMKKYIIPSYIRSMIICLVINPTITRLQLNKELQYLGWNNFKLDNHTLQLAIAYSETERATA